MFANQAHWLLLNVRNAVRYTGTSHSLEPGDIVVVTSTQLAIGPPDGPALDRARAALARVGAGTALAWSAAPNPDADLLLHARGFRESFRPRWMWRDLAMPLPSPRFDDAVALVEPSPADGELLRAARTVPYLPTSHVELILQMANAADRERCVRMLVARHRNGQVLGSGIVHLDAAGVAGMYNVGVDPAWRGRGIGTALVAALGRIARTEGARAIALNATPDGEPIYRALDFVVIGDGQTWYAPAAIVESPPPAMTVRTAEALGRGELESLDHRVARMSPMPNGESPVAFAARFGQVDAVRWLIGHGADPDVLALWSLGMRDEALVAMTVPTARDRQAGTDRGTPLHEAVRRNDRELVAALLKAGADLEARDATWHARPVEWAEALGRPELAAMILASRTNRFA
jgi:ribosomal protein S18 acetylase RimI-like enzyme